VRAALLILVAAIAGASSPAAPGRTEKGDVVDVAATGSSGRTAGAEQSFAYGIVLRNHSSTRDALGVQLRVAVMGAGGVIGIYAADIPLIPAGTTFYVGNEPALQSGSQRAVRIQAAAVTSATQRRHGVLPRATARIANGRVAGTVTNTLRRPIATTSRLYAVYLDSHGKVVGGGRLAARFAGRRTIGAGKRAAFVARLGAAMSPSRVAAVRVSVVPRLVPKRR
jgi:hypothetical protein